MADQPKQKLRQPKRKNHHNGAAEAPETTGDLNETGSKMSKKDRKMEMLTRQLEAEKTEKAEIGEQLKKLQAELEAMKSAQMAKPPPDKEVLNEAGDESPGGVSLRILGEPVVDFVHNGS
nr:uncharacterized protein LOC109407491 [Aedes albopictus]